MSNNDRHQKKMQKLKTNVDAAIARAPQQQSVVVLLTGDGKAKSSSAFGMVMRSLGYGHRVAVVQFIKGEQLSGEELYLRQLHPEVPLIQMATGFTWNTQDRELDRAAAERTWRHAEQFLQDPSLQLLVLDELTYMLSFSYLDENTVIQAIKNRAKDLSVVITGRGGGRGLHELADTVSEVKDIKHAFSSGIAARLGVDY